jgi:adenine-specific DNA-methyltransferase
MPSLDFKGKQFVYTHHLTVPFRELVIDAKKSLTDKAKPNMDDNLIIHGDNLHALKALLPRYAGKVKCIYIDPPYNTGNEGWHYNDNVRSPLIQEWLKHGNPVEREDMERHDKWLSMMWPRLHLLRELMREDGGILVSIDYNEEARLRLLMDEIFGEENYRNTFVVARVKKNIQETEKVKAVNFGYNSVVFYARSDLCLINPPKRAQRKEERWHAFDAPGIRSTMEFEIFDKKPPQGRHWMYSKEIVDAMIQKGEIRKSSKSGSIQYLLAASDFTLLDTNWTDIQESDSQWGFPNGEKNIELVKRIVQMLDEPNAIIVDSFAGSGTTGHAVLDLNKDGGNRKFILVECEDYADKITAERVRRVIKGVKDARDEGLKRGLGGSFTFCTLGQELNVETLLKDERLPDFPTLARYVFYTATGQTLAKVAKPGKDFFIGETEMYRVHLVYKPDREFLRSGASALNSELVERITAKSKKKALVFATAKFMGQRELSEHRIEFAQLPYAIYRVLGD